MLVAPEVATAEVVGEDDDEVRLRRICGGKCGARGEQEKEDGAEEGDAGRFVEMESVLGVRRV